MLYVQARGEFALYEIYTESMTSRCRRKNYKNQGKGHRDRRNKCRSKHIIVSGKEREEVIAFSTALNVITDDRSNYSANAPNVLNPGDIC